MNRINYDNVYLASWWLCVVTLPITTIYNSVFLIALGIVWLAEGNFIEKWRRVRNSWWILPFLFFFTMHLVGLIYSRDLQTGYFEIEKKLSFLMVPIIAASGKPLNNSTVHFLQRSFVYACLAVVLISLVITFVSLSQLPHPPLQNFDPKTSEHFNMLNPGAEAWWQYFSYIQVGEWNEIHPAYFSMYLIFCLAILVSNALERSRPNFVDIAIMVLLSLFLVLLASRMAIISLVVVVSYLIYQRYKRKDRQRVVLVYCSFLLLLFISIWSDPVSRFRIIQEPLTTSFNFHQDKSDWNSVSFRLLEWRASIQELKASPWLGVGTGDGQVALQHYYSNFSPSTVGLTYNSHNQYLQTALELGLVGLGLLLVCFIKPLFSAMQQNPLYVAFIVLFGLMCLTESVLARQKGIVFFTIFQSLFLRSGFNQ